MYTWHYVWSPRYSLFHHTLFGQIGKLEGFDVKPVFFEQHIFTRKEGADGKHFLTGIGIKIYVLLKNLQANPGKYHVFSDVDILCLKDNLSALLKQYEKNDITCMRERFDTEEYNIGFMFVKSTAGTIELFSRVLERIRAENKLDQDVFNEEIKQFSGSHGHFSIPEFIQSNMMEELCREEDYAIIQCLSSEMNPEKMLIEKIATLTNFFDITALRNHIDSKTEEQLCEYLYGYDPLNYVLRWPKRILSPHQLP